MANAGIASHYDSLEYTEENWSNIMKVNVRAPDADWAAWNFN